MARRGLDALGAAQAGLTHALADGDADAIAVASADLAAACEDVAAVSAWRSDAATRARTQVLAHGLDQLHRRVRMLTLLQQGRVEQLTRVAAARTGRFG
ncbi:MAG: hypothetical protein RLZZ58_1073 [Pseudomonadota bacterium]